MYFAFPSMILAICFAAAAEARALRVCADPNNLPFSNDQREGFENKIAALIATKLSADVEYFWRPQRRGFLRTTLKARSCDMVMGVPLGQPGLRTIPLYRSSYVFLMRPMERPITSLDDARLRQLKVGVQLGGDDGAASPPGLALARRGIAAVGYTVVGDYRYPNPPARIVEAVRDGDIDVAVVWGPLAGYFAGRSHAGLVLKPVGPEGSLPMSFNIGIGVRADDEALAQEVETIISDQRPAVEAILDSYAVPRARGEKDGP
jgi:mxaJ protein